VSAALRTTLLEAIDRMQGVRVLVVADLVLDVFEYGRIGRVSREAPVLILDHVRTERVPGGGANAVHNLCALGGVPVVVGRVGADGPGRRLSEMLAAAGADVGGVVSEAGYATPEKRRILAGSSQSVQQQIVRVDRGGGPVPVTAEDISRRVGERVGGTRGTLVSDYSFGLLHPGNVAALQEAAGSPARPLFVDSRRQLRLFKGLAAATPNLQEAEAFAGGPIDDDPKRLAAAAESLRRALEARAVVVTLGSHGMLLAADGALPVRIPVWGTDEVADVTGAGDTVIATLTLAVLSGCGYREAALLANYAGGIVVMKRGTATVHPDELRRAVREDSGLETRVRPA
jgi:D-glycero-beta-D-manno-heptose-7-phosphate kinase